MLTAKEAREIRDASLKPLEHIMKGIRNQSENGNSSYSYANLPPAVRTLLRENGYSVTDRHTHWLIEW